MSISDYAAWYAAVVATIALYQEYRRGRLRLRVRAKGGMVSLEPHSYAFGGPGIEVTHVVVTVRHINGPPTTITHIALYAGSGLLQRLRMAKRFSWVLDKMKVPWPKAAIIPQPGNASLPHKLEIGQEWVCTILQEEVEKYAAHGTPYICICHVLSDREVIAPIYLPASSPPVPATS